MRYGIYIERYAQKQILKLDKKAIPVIKTAIAKLAKDLPKAFIPNNLLSIITILPACRIPCV
jgi:mRNA-degrading endonuclease RelE of RelBE toxin-antitoxin system